MEKYGARSIESNGECDEQPERRSARHGEAGPHDVHTALRDDLQRPERGRLHLNQAVSPASNDAGANLHDPVARRGAEHLATCAQADLEEASELAPLETAEHDDRFRANLSNHARQLLRTAVLVPAVDHQPAGDAVARALVEFRVERRRGHGDGGYEPAVLGQQPRDDLRHGAAGEENAEGRHEGQQHGDRDGSQRRMAPEVRPADGENAQTAADQQRQRRMRSRAPVAAGEQQSDHQGAAEFSGAVEWHLPDAEERGHPVGHDLHGQRRQGSGSRVTGSNGDDAQDSTDDMASRRTCPSLVQRDLGMHEDWGSTLPGRRGSPTFLGFACVRLDGVRHVSIQSKGMAACTRLAAYTSRQFGAIYSGAFWETNDGPSCASARSILSGPPSRGASAHEATQGGAAIARRTARASRRRRTEE